MNESMNEVLNALIINGSNWSAIKQFRVQLESYSDPTIRTNPNIAGKSSHFTIQTVSGS